MESQFHIGQAVTAKAFTDSRQNHHKAVTGLHVIEVRKIESDLPKRFALETYYRIKAIGENGRGCVEAAERFFEAS